MAHAHDDRSPAAGRGPEVDRPGRASASAPTRADRRTRQESPLVAVDRFRSAYAESPVGFALLTSAGHVAHANLALCRLLDSPEPALLDRPLSHLVHPDDGHLVAAALADASSGMPAARVVARFEIDGAGPRWADVTLHLIRDRSDTPYLFTVHVEDQTDHVEVLSQLGHAARVSLVSEMAPGIGHDLRNSLAVLRAHAELLTTGLTDETQLSQIRAMADAINRAHALAGQLIDLVHPGPPSRQLLDLGGLVASLAPVLETMAPPEVSLQVHLAPGALVAGDPVELERVLLTLVANALDAIDGPGALTIDVGQVDGLGRPGESRRQVRLRITDTGRGMDADTLARAFEPYFTTKRTGTGLGLASSRSLVEALGGSVELNTEPGSGTTVDVLLDAAGEPAHADDGDG